MKLNCADGAKPRNIAKASQKHRRAMQGSTAALIAIILPIFIII